MGKDIVMPKLRNLAQESFETPREALSRLYATRDTNELGEIFGVTRRTILNVMDKLRINRRPRHTPAPKGVVAAELTRRGRTTGQSAREMFINLYQKKGLSLEALSFELGVAPQSVANFAKARGIALRPGGRPKGKNKSRRAFNWANCV